MLYSLIKRKLWIRVLCQLHPASDLFSLPSSSSSAFEGDHASNLAYHLTTAKNDRIMTI